jgi:hypothetical protein
MILGANLARHKAEPVYEPQNASCDCRESGASKGSSGDNGGREASPIQSADLDDRSTRPSLPRDDRRSEICSVRRCVS